MLKANFVSKYLKAWNRILSIKYNIKIYNYVEVLMAILEVSPSRAEGAPMASSWTVGSQGAPRTQALWWQQGRDNHPASMSLETCQRANDVTLGTATHKGLFSGELSTI